MTMEANNVERMRKCIDNLIQMVCSQCRYKCNGKLCSGVAEARSLLALPLRNCDMGTVAEQTARMRENCNRYKPSCKGCKYVTDLQKENCWLAWAQSPYDTQEADA